MGTKFCHLPEAWKTKSKGSLLQNTQSKGMLLDENVMTRSFSNVYYCVAKLSDLLLPFTRE